MKSSGRMRERYKRLIILSAHLLGHPREQMSLTELSSLLDVAKSTLSEDLMLVKGVLENAGYGSVLTQVGVQGGVIYFPHLDLVRARHSLKLWVARLIEPERLTSDGFLYMTDLLFDPALVDPLGELLAFPFADLHVDTVATVETKGIPLAMACARALGTEVVLIRRDSRLSEGSAVSINYLSGSSRRIQSMSLSRRALKPGSSVLFVDDFMKAGGTARAAADLLREFGATVVGVGVLVATKDPANKLIDRFWSLLEWHEESLSRVVPSEWANALCRVGKE